MTRKVAVLAVNPVNGAGLFQYLEAFYENGIAYKVFAIAETTKIKTNSGVGLQTDDVVANLKGHEDEYDALVFSCGDGLPKFSENVGKQFNQDMLDVIKNFDSKGKMLVGHCAAALMFDRQGVGAGKRVALHPFVRNIVKSCIGTDDKIVIEGNLYTAQTEHTISLLIPELLKVLKLG